MSESIQAVVIGASGYVGGELLRLLVNHPNFELAAAVSDSRAGEAIADTFAHLSQAFGNTTFVARDQWSKTIPDGSQVALFSAAPHGASAETIAAALATASSKGLQVHVVDSSADFRYAEQASLGGGVRRKPWRAATIGSVHLCCPGTSCVDSNAARWPPRAVLQRQPCSPLCR